MAVLDFDVRETLREQQIEEPQHCQRDYRPQQRLKPCRDAAGRWIAHQRWLFIRLRFGFSTFGLPSAFLMRDSRFRVRHSFDCPAICFMMAAKSISAPD